MRVDARIDRQILEETLHGFQGFTQFIGIQIILLAHFRQLSQNIAVHHRVRFCLRADLEKELFVLDKFVVQREDEWRNFIVQRQVQAEVFALQELPSALRIDALALFELLEDLGTTFVFDLMLKVMVDRFENGHENVVDHMLRRTSRHRLDIAAKEKDAE